MKRFIRIVCLVIVLSFLVAIPAYATEQTPRASDYFGAYSAYCYEASATKLEVYFTVIAVSEMDELGVSTIKVQRSSDGINWTTVKTYAKGSYPNLVDTDTGAHASSVACTKTAGYYYRARVTFYAKNNSGTGYLNYYTSKI